VIVARGLLATADPCQNNSLAALLIGSGEAEENRRN